MPGTTCSSISLGGLSVNEPAADLGIVAAIASSLRNRPVREGTAVFGEVGLGGEVRGITQAELRVKEASQLGFTTCLVPKNNCPGSVDSGACELVGVGSVEEALEALIG